MSGAPIHVIDLFAGPGGLGEGFASRSDVFRILVSAECSDPAHQTLRLRAFKRLLEREGLSLTSYYDYVAGRAPTPVTANNKDAWHCADQEAQRLELGKESDDRELEGLLEKERLESRDDWVLIGGPPCQAYSMVGRARNRSNIGYVPEEDQRHFLYLDYLKLIQHYRPAVFVMENVKGMLSSQVGGRRIFHQILEDLTRPDEALGRSSNGHGYRIHSLMGEEVVYEHGDDIDEFLRAFGHEAFLVHAEYFGVPQTRHRVFLVGIREDLQGVAPCPLRCADQEPTVSEVLSDLPALRSGLSRNDSEEAWRQAVVEQGKQLAAEASAAGKSAVAEELARQVNKLASMPPLTIGAQRVPKQGSSKGPTERTPLHRWLECEELDVWLNHQARTHMPSDLGRYLYAAAFTNLYGRSPVGAEEFDLPSLAPNHANWASGKFADRFRVQPWNQGSKTITSHICKDGHYYIHPAPWQCRSFSVREAARIQTFPDDYFFEGNRTEQYHQVGNAVPPWLARQIAEIVHEILCDAGLAPTSREADSQLTLRLA